MSTQTVENPVIKKLNQNWKKNIINSYKSNPKDKRKLTVVHSLKQLKPMR